MISLPLFKRNMKTGIFPFLLILAVLSLYTTVIIYMYHPELAETLNTYQQTLPEMMAAVGMTGMASSLLEWIQIYLYGFIMLLFPLIFLLMMVQKLLMGMIDKGTLANFLATPNSRGKIIWTQLFSMILWLFLLMGMITVIGIVSCEVMFPGKLEIETYLALNLRTFLLQLAVLAFVFLTASFCSENKYYYLAGAGVPVLCFLMQMLSNMGEKLEKLKYVTIYTLLAAEEIIDQGPGFGWQGLLLLGISFCMILIGVRRFQKRDFFL